jgi:hypothetical protein
MNPVRDDMLVEKQSFAIMNPVRDDMSVADDMSAENILLPTCHPYGILYGERLFFYRHAVPHGT